MFQQSDPSVKSSLPVGNDAWGWDTSLMVSVLNRTRSYGRRSNEVWRARAREAFDAIVDFSILVLSLLPFYMSISSFLRIFVSILWRHIRSRLATEGSQLMTLAGRRRSSLTSVQIWAEALIHHLSLWMNAATKHSWSLSISCIIACDNSRCSFKRPLGVTSSGKRTLTYMMEL